MDTDSIDSGAYASLSIILTFTLLFYIQKNTVALVVQYFYSIFYILYFTSQVEGSRAASVVVSISSSTPDLDE